MANVKIRQKEKNKIPIKQFDKKEDYKKKLKNNFVKIKEKTKIEEKHKIPLKQYNKKLNYKKKLKNDIIRIKERINTKKKENEEENPNNYSINRISQEAETTANKGVNQFNRYGKKAIKETRQNIQKGTQKIKQKIQNKSIKKLEKAIKHKIKESTKTIKTAKQTGKTTYKVAKQTGKMTYKATKATVKGIKAGIKATITTMKAIIMATKALIYAIIAGGWVAVLIIVIICLIGLICSSVFGIFFSSEKDVGNKTMSSVIREINVDFTNKITDIQKNNKHDEYEIKSDRAEWKDILSVYSVIVSNGDEATDVVTLNDKKIEKLKEIFWEMNIITSNVKTEEKQIETVDENGNTKTKIVKRKVLYINIQNKSVQEMIERYNFNEQQLKQLAELQKDEYNSMWSYVLYGSSLGSNEIVQVALSQVGNIGGQPYWSWYRF